MTPQERLARLWTERARLLDKLERVESKAPASHAAGRRLRHLLEPLRDRLDEMREEEVRLLHLINDQN